MNKDRDNMTTIDELRNMCIAPNNFKAYYRPFICRGELSTTDIFFVGTNPATPILEKDLEIDEYIRLLLNYDEFIKFYKKSRVSKGKTEFSRTRTGINAFMEWLSTKTKYGILETNVIPYPTERLKLLWKEPLNIIENGKDIFYKILIEFKPRLLILHGKKTFIQVIEMLTEKGMLMDSDIDLSHSIEQIERQVPFINFEYSNGKKGYLISCRHFMYYGITGKSFSKFRDKIEELINNKLI